MFVAKRLGSVSGVEIVGGGDVDGVNWAVDNSVYNPFFLGIVFPYECVD